MSFLHSIKYQHIASVWAVSAVFFGRKEIQAWVRPLDEAWFDRRHSQRKRDLLRSVEGETLELGSGIGSNFQYMPKDITYFGLGRQKRNHQALLSHAGKEGFAEATITLEYDVCFLAQLQRMPDQRFDSVIAMRSLSGYEQDELQQVLSEIKRILKPGGRFYFVEYTKQTTSFFSSLVQQIYQPWFLVTRLFPSESLTSRVAENIFESGFQEIYMESWPSWLNEAEPRAGIQLVEIISSSDTKSTLPEKSTDSTIADQSKVGNAVEKIKLSGLDGFTPVVAGVCVKSAPRKEQGKSDADWTERLHDDERRIVNVIGKILERR